MRFGPTADSGRDTAVKEDSAVEEVLSAFAVRDVVWYRNELAGDAIEDSRAAEAVAPR